MGIGRTDFPDGDLSTLLDSIKNKLMKLDDNVVVYPDMESQLPLDVSGRSSHESICKVGRT